MMTMELDDLKSCPFCGEALNRVDSLAQSFDPPRMYHEYHHPRNDCVALRSLPILWAGEAGSEHEAAWIAKWNRRAALPTAAATAVTELVERMQNMAIGLDASPRNLTHVADLLREAAAALSSTGEAGWVLVPRAATEVMTDAAIAEMQAQEIAFDEFSPPIYPAKVFAAMVAAAPARPSGQSREEIVEECAKVAEADSNKPIPPDWTEADIIVRGVRRAVAAQIRAISPSPPV